VTRRLLLAVLLVIAAPAQAWWNCDWNQRFAADITAPSGGPQSNYAVRLNLTSGTVPAGFNWAGNGRDLRLIAQDDVTPRNFVIEQWNATARTAIVWVLVPTLSGTQRVYLYFDGPASAPPGWNLLAMPQLGTKFHTRRSTVDPANRAQADTAFANGQNVAGYGCLSPDSFVGISNAILFGSINNNQNDIVLFAEVFFEVAAGQAGVWEFRYGADFGRGGGLYVDDVTLEQDWNSDLWWNNNWNGAAGVLQGSINLAAGVHSLRILGSDGCCDGGLTVQFRQPGGLWQDLTTTNIQLRARQCSNSPEPTVAWVAGQLATCPDLAVIRSSAPYSDPVNNTNNPKSIPGAVILNTTEVRNAGAGTVDSGTLVITETIAANTALQVANFDGSTNGPVQFVDGPNSSGLSYVFVSLGNTGDDLTFSNNGGATYTYTPVPDADGVDLAVTHFQIEASNPFAGNGGSGFTSARFLFKTRIR
jgi:hypothetical protein